MNTVHIKYSGLLITNQVHVYIFYSVYNVSVCIMFNVCLCLYYARCECPKSKFLFTLTTHQSQNIESICFMYKYCRYVKTVNTLYYVCVCIHVSSAIGIPEKQKLPPPPTFAVDSLTLQLENKKNSNNKSRKTTVNL